MRLEWWHLDADRYEGNLPRQDFRSTGGAKLAVVFEETLLDAPTCRPFTTMLHREVKVSRPLSTLRASHHARGPSPCDAPPLARTPPVRRTNPIRPGPKLLQQPHFITSSQRKRTTATGIRQAKEASLDISAIMPSWFGPQASACGFGGFRDHMDLRAVGRGGAESAVLACASPTYPCNAKPMRLVPTGWLIACIYCSLIMRGSRNGV
ncbi:hypothetical protein IWZ01DRAFT_260961 [Phyllosticta capitalensis]